MSSLGSGRIFGGEFGHPLGEVEDAFEILDDFGFETEGDETVGFSCGETFGEDLTHPVACGFLESLRHQFDAEQKEGETSEEAHHNRAEGKGGRGFCENEQHGRNSSAIHGVT